MLPSSRGASDRGGLGCLLLLGLALTLASLLALASASDSGHKALTTAAGKRRHGSTALFVAVDFTFLLAFAGFLAYLVGSWILPSVTSSA